MSSDEYPEAEINELRGGLILEQDFDSDNSLFEEEEFSAAFARTLFVTAQTLSVTTPEITTTATTIMNNVTTFLGSGNTICQADRTPQELSIESKLYPKENRADLKANDANSYHCMVEKLCTGMDTKFSLLEPIAETSGPEQSKKSYNGMTRMKELKKALQDNGILDCMHYAGALSGSSWYLSTLYTHHQFPR